MKSRPNHITWYPFLYKVLVASHTFLAKKYGLGRFKIHKLKEIMAAVVRVKRRIDEDPADSLIVSCKKLKQADENLSVQPSTVDELKTLFRFAATVQGDVSVVKLVWLTLSLLPIPGQTG